jgi:hypothetical protein
LSGEGDGSRLQFLIGKTARVCVWDAASYGVGASGPLIDGGMRMHEPSGVTPGSSGFGPAGAQSGSGAASTGETMSGDAARMEHAIDQFLRHDRDDRPEDDPPSADDSAFDALARHGVTDIIVRLAPRRLDDPERLPRIVTSSLPIRPPPLPGDDRWRRQFISALSDADDGAPTARAMPTPLASYARTAPAGSRRNLPAQEPGLRRADKSAELSPFAARWHAARRVLAAAGVTTCLFSTGMLWALHRSEMVAEIGSQPAQPVAQQPASTADAAATPAPPIRNTPVLIREGETFARVPASAETGWHHASPAGPSTASASASAPIVSRIINVSGPPLAFPDVPIAPAVRIVPVVPIVPAKPIMPAAQILPAGPIAPAAPIALVAAAGQAATIAPSQPVADAAAPDTSQPPLDRIGLTESAAPPAKAPAIDRKRTRHARPARTASGGGSSEPFRSRKPTAAVARGRVPADGWVMQRQSLRSEPEPEPSTLKKLISLVWPPGKSSTTAEPSKPAAPAATKPVHPHQWSDSTRANP